MNKKNSILLFLLTPLLFLLLAITLRDAQGPHWLGSTTDPDYAYLFNSLSLTQNFPIGHIDHPGTPVQTIGAFVIKSIARFKNSPDVVSDVFRDSETYLNGIQNVILLLNLIIVFALGYFTYRWTRNVLLSLLVQLTPFFSTAMIVNPILKVSPETLLFFTSSFFLLLLILIIYKPDFREKSVIFFAFIMGFGTATKLTFFPLILIPLYVLPNFRTKLLLLIGSAISFYFFTKPIVNEYPALWGWIKALFIHSGVNAEGAATIIDFKTFIPNILNQIKAEPLFFIIMAFGLVAFLFSVISFTLKRTNKDNFKLKLLAGLLCVELIQTLLIAKHPGASYMIPTLSLSVITLVLSAQLLSETRISKALLKRVKPLYLFLLVLLLISARSTVELNKLSSNLTQNRNEQLAVNNELETKYKDSIIIRYQRSSSHLYALRFGNIFVHSTFTPHLEKVYPNTYFWDIWYGSLVKWDNRTITLKEIIDSHPNKDIVLSGTAFDRYEAYPNYIPKFPIENIYNKEGNTLEAETIYRLILK